MKKVSLILSAVVMTAMMLSSCGDGASTAEGASNEVTIGNQVWMTKNLDVSTFRNGDPIPEAKTSDKWKAYVDAEEAAWCYFDNDPRNGEKYGKLYNWYAVNDPRGLAPEGWHVPSDEEWTQLTDYLGGREKAGAKMKSENGWSNDGSGTNSSGFSGLPGGYRNFGTFNSIGISGFTFNFIGISGFWWSSTEIATYYSLYRHIECKSGWLYRGNDIKGEGLSVRCLRD